MNLWDIAAIDQHAHCLLKPQAAEAVPYPAAFTESSDPAIVRDHARHTLFFRRSVPEIAALLECEPSEEAIVLRRRELGFEAIAERCFHAARLESVFIDDGFLPEASLPLEWHQKLVRARRVLRVEHLAETLISEADSFERFLERFGSELDPPPAQVVALKTIAAYRSGLEIAPAEKARAQAGFEALKRQSAEGPVRLQEKPLLDFLVALALELCAKHRLPMQFHTGFGDPDLDLRLSNPLHLRSLIEKRHGCAAPLVLLHAGYPYVREAAYLASVYPHVYVDIGLVVPFLSIAGMRSVIRQLLELAPISKVMFSTDAHTIPELYYLGAKWGREALSDVLESAVRDSDLTAREAATAARAILAENARRLYLENRVSKAGTERA